MVGLKQNKHIEFRNLHWDKIKKREELWDLFRSGKISESKYHLELRKYRYENK